jgi:hypothetical protein
MHHAALLVNFMYMSSVNYLVVQKGGKKIAARARSALLGAWRCSIIGFSFISYTIGGKQNLQTENSQSFYKS